MHQLLAIDTGIAVRSVGYIAVACLCASIALTQSDGRPHPPLLSQWRFWMAIAAVLLSLALVRELRVTHIIGGPVRDFAHEHDLYEKRRPIQLLAVLVIAAGGVVAAAISAWYLRAYRWWELFTTLGVLYVLSFLAIRAVSLHNIDTVLFRSSIAGVHVGVLLEFAGILFVGGVAFGAFVDVRRGAAKRGDAASSPAAAK